MFKAQVLRRSFSLFSLGLDRRIARSAVRDGHETITVHRYRIKHRFFSTSRMVGAVTLIGATHGLIRYLDIQIELLETKVEDQKKPRLQNEHGTKRTCLEPGQKADKHHISSGEDGDVLLFLPTGFSRPKPQKLYRGTDPDWEEFRKLAKNRQRVMRIREELTGIVRGFIVKSAPSFSRLTKRLGRIDEKQGKTWIEFKFPDGPPIEYERPGIEVTDDLEWRITTRPVGSRNHELMERALFPATAAALLYEDTKSKIWGLWNNLEAYLNQQKKSGLESVQQTTQRVGEDQLSNSRASTSPPHAGSQSSLNLHSKNTQRLGTSPQTAHPKVVGFDLPEFAELTLDLARFREGYCRSSKPFKMHAPPGSFIIHALIQVCGERANVTLNVLAIYDVKQGRFDNMKISVWNFTEKRQYPKGGP